MFYSVFQTLLSSWEMVSHGFQFTYPVAFGAGRARIRTMLSTGKAGVAPAASQVLLMVLALMVSITMSPGEGDLPRLMDGRPLSQREAPTQCHTHAHTQAHNAHTPQCCSSLVIPVRYAQVSPRSSRDLPRGRW